VRFFGFLVEYLHEYDDGQSLFFALSFVRFFGFLVEYLHEYGDGQSLFFALSFVRFFWWNICTNMMMEISFLCSLSVFLILSLLPNAYPLFSSSN